MAIFLRRLATNSGRAPITKIPSTISKIPSQSLNRSVFCRSLCTDEEIRVERTERTQKLERIADELLRLNKMEHKEYSALLRQKMGLRPWGTAPPPGEEKPKYDVKLLDFNLGSKFEVMEKIKGFSCLSLDEIEDLMENAPAVVKKGVTAEEAFKILDKLKQAGATAVLE